jgi:hypothetical protein
MEITLEEIQKKFESLPEDLKWAIMAAKVDDNILEIGQTNNLNVEQMGQLSLETYMVMLGFTRPDKFEDSLKKSLQLADEKIKTIVNSVNEKILKEIRLNMMEPVAPTENTEHEIMKSAGIEIIPEKLEITGGEAARPIFAEKLSMPVQSQTTRTEHTLDNLSKTNTGEVPIATSEKPKIDPYREIPE